MSVPPNSSSPPSSNTPAPEPPEEAAPKLGISSAQVAGSALSAVSVAVFASWAGTAGTLIGAAIGSILGTVGSAWYTYSLKRTGEVVRQGARQAGLVPGSTRALRRVDRNQPGGATQSTAAQGDEDTSTTRMDAVTQADLEAADAGDADDDGGRRDWKATLKALPWKKLIITMVIVMVLGLALITVIEKVTGKPLSGGSGSGTTIGSVTNRDKSDNDEPTDEPSPTEQTNPTDDGTQNPTDNPTDNPTGNPSTPPTDNPTDGSTPTDQPTDQPTDEPTDQPTTQPSPTPGSGGGATEGAPEPEDPTATPQLQDPDPA